MQKCTKVHKSARMISSMINVNKIKKVSKGYRLRPKTHELIRELKKYLKGTADDSIYLACKKLLEEIKKK